VLHRPLEITAFHGGSLAFTIPYVMVRVIGLSLYSWVTWEHPTQRMVVRTFALVSVAGLAAVIAGGIVGDMAQYGLWGLAILLDVVAAAIATQQDGWDLNPEHFGERHGLFVIIALGETLIVAAGGLAGAAWTGTTITVAMLAVATSCALWWTYFPTSKPTLEEALAKQTGVTQATMARDVFSLMHFRCCVG
jgi:low temperature requirement protein LtrA